MQLRFDGHFGFPGGLVKEDENVYDAINRELREEIHLDPEFYITGENYLFSHVHQCEKICLHFFVKELSRKEFVEVEKNTFEAEDYGDESLGTIRVPMLTKKDGYRGFPAFLGNGFAGNARDQLLNFLIHANLMTSQDITTALEKAQKGPTCPHRAHQQ